jgi:hypothetical protein
VQPPSCQGRITEEKIAANNPKSSPTHEDVDGLFFPTDTRQIHQFGNFFRYHSGTSCTCLIIAWPLLGDWSLSHLTAPTLNKSKRACRIRQGVVQVHPNHRASFIVCHSDGGEGSFIDFWSTRLKKWIKEWNQGWMSTA